MSKSLLESVQSYIEGLVNVPLWMWMLFALLAFILFKLDVEEIKLFNKEVDTNSRLIRDNFSEGAKVVSITIHNGKKYLILHSLNDSERLNIIVDINSTVLEGDIWTLEVDKKSADIFLVERKKQISYVDV